MRAPTDTPQAPAGGAAAPASGTTVLRLTDVCKTFPGTKALAGVDLEIAEGEIHALVGQNGSGKSTLIKILAGYHLADPGADGRLNGEQLDFSRPGAKHDRLRFVHQDLGLFLELNAIDNLALRSQYLTAQGLRVDWKRQRAEAERLLADFDLDLALDRPLSEATPVQRTIVAIAASLAGWEGGPGVLVLDEPTAVLPPSDVERLLDIVQRVRARGTSILYVSHRLNEVFRIADRVTVLRGGRLVVTRPVTGLDPQSLAELMVGSDVDAGYRAGLQTDRDAPVVLRARGLRGRYLDGVDLDLRAGEILGIAGLPGSGRDELPYAIVGAAPEARGSIALGGADLVDLRKARDFDIPIVPADRAREAVVAEFSVGENVSLSVLRRFSQAGWLRRRHELDLIQDWASTIQIKAASVDDKITTLSGGNQQKVIMARCLARDPKVLVLCEPTAGVDVGTRQAIYEFIAEQARNGLAVVVSSTDTGDLLALCTRVLVMANGRVVCELADRQISEQSLLHAMEGIEQR